MVSVGFHFLQTDSVSFSHHDGARIQVPTDRLISTGSAISVGTEEVSHPLRLQILAFQSRGCKGALDTAFLSRRGIGERRMYSGTFSSCCADRPHHVKDRRFLVRCYYTTFLSNVQLINVSDEGTTIL